MSKYEAKVLEVKDGDTFEAEVYGEFFDVELKKTIKVRMAKIDAPETKGKEKSRGLVSEKWLKDKIENKIVQLEVGELDYYKRYLCTVFLDNENLNELMLKEKLAEIYSPENHNDGELDV